MVRFLADREGFLIVGSEKKYHGITPTNYSNKNQLRSKSP
jgi:hypothetical protein